MSIKGLPPDHFVFASNNTGSGDSNTYNGANNTGGGIGFSGRNGNCGGCTCGCGRGGVDRDKLYCTHCGRYRHTR